MDGGLDACDCRRISFTNRKSSRLYLMRSTHDWMPAQLLRLDVELLAESAPLLLLFADGLRGALRCAAAVCGQTQRQEALLDIGAAEEAIDLAIELRDHLGRCACRREAAPAA
jgi:hypothetical protein